MTVSEFIDHWMDAKDCGGASNSFQEVNGKSVLYLKDRHFVKDHGLLFMLMFSSHIVGQQMCAGRRNGFFSLLLNVILCLTGALRAVFIIFLMMLVKQNFQVLRKLSGWSALKNRMKLSWYLVDGIIKCIIWKIQYQ